MFLEKYLYSLYVESMEGVMEFNFDLFFVIFCVKVVEGY